MRRSLFIFSTVAFLILLSSCTLEDPNVYTFSNQSSYVVTVFGPRTILIHYDNISLKPGEIKQETWLTDGPIGYSPSDLVRVDIGGTYKRNYTFRNR